MADYRYLTADLMTGVIREPMAFTEVSFVENVRGSDTFDSKIDLADVNATRDILNPEGTLIVAERDGSIVWSGIYFDPARPDKNSLGVHASGLGYYLEHIYVDIAHTYVGTDPATIVTTLLNDALTKPDILPIVVPAIDPTGTSRTIIFDPNDEQTLAEALDSLALVPGGFDWFLEAVWVGDPRHAIYQFGMAAPSRGVDSTWVLEYPGNVADYEMPQYGSRRATDVKVTGQGAGSLPFVATASSRDIKPRLEVRKKVSDKVDQTGLDAIATGVLNAAKKEVVTITLHMAPDAEPGFAQIAPGDRAHLRIRDGYFQFDSTIRVVGRSTTPGDVEKIDLAVVDESAVTV